MIYLTEAEIALDAYQNDFRCDTVGHGKKSHNAVLPLMQLHHDNTGMGSDDEEGLWDS